LGWLGLPVALEIGRQERVIRQTPSAGLRGTTGGIRRLPSTRHGTIQALEQGPGAGKRIYISGHITVTGS
jgi:hypothetical protein